MTRSSIELWITTKLRQNYTWKKHSHFNRVLRGLLTKSEVWKNRTSGLPRHCGDLNCIFIKEDTWLVDIETHCGVTECWTISGCLFVSCRCCWEWHSLCDCLKYWCVGLAVKPSTELNYTHTASLHFCLCCRIETGNCLCQFFQI